MAHKRSTPPLHPDGVHRSIGVRQMRQWEPNSTVSPDTQLQYQGDSQTAYRRQRYIDSRSRRPPIEQLRVPHAIHRPPTYT